MFVLICVRDLTVSLKLLCVCVFSFRWWWGAYHDAAVISHREHSVDLRRPPLQLPDRRLLDANNTHTHTYTHTHVHTHTHTHTPLSLTVTLA